LERKNLNLTIFRKSEGKENSISTKKIKPHEADYIKYIIALFSVEQSTAFSFKVWKKGKALTLFMF